MNEKLFRKASIEKITGPEQLDDYIRVDSPSLWAVLAAAVILLIAVLIWSTTGTLPTTVSVVGVAKNGITETIPEKGIHLTRIVRLVNRPVVF